MLDRENDCGAACGVFVVVDGTIGAAGAAGGARRTGAEGAGRALATDGTRVRYCSRTGSEKRVSVHQ